MARHQKVLRTLLFTLASLVVVVALYLVMPPLSIIDSGDVAASAPVVHNSNNVCKDNTIYVTNETREIHERESYRFVVDNNCANLQEQLVSAVRQDNVNDAAKLIAIGANPQTADWSTFEPTLPLHVAVYESPEMVKLLLDNGANVNQEQCCCATCSSPLTIAIQENNAETVRLLLERGADVEYRPKFTDGESFSPLQLAIGRGNTEIIELVRRACERILECRVRSRASSFYRR